MDDLEYLAALRDYSVQDFRWHGKGSLYLERLTWDTCAQIEKSIQVHGGQFYYGDED